MRLIGSSVMCCLTLSLLPGMTYAFEPNIRELTQCSSHFAARAEWLRGIEGNPVTRQMFDRYAEMLLRSAQLKQAAVERADDSGIDVLGGHGAYKLESTRSEMVQDILTDFVTRGFGTTGLPSCMEDAVCNHCVDIVKQVSP